MPSARRSAAFLTTAIFCLSVLWATPTALAVNECQPTGSPGSAPCVTVATPAGTYYVFLFPDRDGNPLNAYQDFRFVWKETNGCPGLQTTKTSYGAHLTCERDLPILL